MTSRRSMQTYGERVSRALQFVPGHVGGRVASAQPIRRRGGTLRSASVGAVAPPTEYIIRPAAIEAASETTSPGGWTAGDTFDAITYTGGAGSSTLSDASDATYVGVYGKSISFVRHVCQSIVTFEAAGLPADLVIGTITLNMRARSISGAFYLLKYVVATQITPDGEYWDVFANQAGTETTDGGWTIVQFEGSAGDSGGTGEWEQIPTVATLNAGELQMALYCNSTGWPLDFEVSDVWLTVIPA